jgi:hypothetical protein
MREVATMLKAIHAAEDVQAAREKAHRVIAGPALGRHDLGENLFALSVVKARLRALDGDHPGFGGGEGVDDRAAEGTRGGAPHLRRARYSPTLMI